MAPAYEEPSVAKQGLQYSDLSLSPCSGPSDQEAVPSPALFPRTPGNVGLFFPQIQKSHTFGLLPVCQLYPKIME